MFGLFRQVLHNIIPWNLIEEINGDQLIGNTLIQLRLMLLKRPAVLVTTLCWRLVCILTSFHDQPRPIPSSRPQNQGFLSLHRVFSAEVSRRTWCTHATGRRTALSTRWLGIAVSTAGCRSASLWECPKSVSVKNLHCTHTCSSAQDIVPWIHTSYFYTVNPAHI